MQEVSLQGSLDGGVCAICLATLYRGPIDRRQHSGKAADRPADKRVGIKREGIPAR
jgi:hypothetical protein